MILAVVVLTGFALQSEAELQTHANTFIAIPNDRIHRLLCDGVRLKKMTLFDCRMEKDVFDLHVSFGEAPVFSVREATDCLKSSFSDNVGSALFRARLNEKNLWLRLFQIPTRELVAEFCAWFSGIRFTLWLSAETTQKRGVRGSGEGRGNGKLLSSMWKCLSHSKKNAFKPECKGTTKPREGTRTRSTLLMTVLCIIGYADHRRKPFCLALIPLESFTFWRIEKNELKIKIISLIWLHPRFMGAAFKDKWKQQQQQQKNTQLWDSHLYHFLSFNIL